MTKPPKKPATPNPTPSPDIPSASPVFASSVTARPVFARHAASLIVVREARSPEVLMGIRGPGHRFLPNRLVFPGGAVDPTDADTQAATEPNPTLTAILQRRAKPRLARAIVTAAARELQEETGLTLGTPPRLHKLDYLCRAITPPNSPIRFNARFLIAPAAAISGDMADTHELHELGFRPVKQVMDSDLMLVTHQVLTRLLAWLALSPAERQARTAFDVFKQRSWQPD